VQAIKTRSALRSEKPQRKYEAAPGASQKIEARFGYLKIR
jgi:hypothetical protein